MDDPRTENSTPAQRASLGLFSSQLDAQQTKSDRGAARKVRSAAERAADDRFDRLFRLYEFYIPPPSAVETQFRHRSWSDRRVKVRAALVACNVPASRLERFDKCGSDAWIQCDPAGENFRIKACYCGDRWCEPCAAARSRKVVKQISRLAEGKTLRFITLTLGQTDDSLAKCLNRLYASFEKLRCQSLWRAGVDGGVYFTEITRGAAGDHWHVHLHALVQGRWIDKRELSAGWRVATGDSFIVHIRPVASNEAGVSYAAKYATKGIDGSVLADLDLTSECILALRGRRLFSLIGCWHGLDLGEPIAPPVKWRTLAKLDDVVRAGLKRQRWAMGLLRAVRSEIALEWSNLPPIDDSG